MEDVSSHAFIQGILTRPFSSQTLLMCLDILGSERSRCKVTSLLRPRSPDTPPTSLAHRL